MENYIIERLKPGDAKGVSRCMYRTYGKCYPSYEVYEPEKIRQLNASGDMISVVARMPNDKVVGHYCIILENIESKLGELGQAVVDPKHRNRGLMKKMRVLLEEIATKKGLIGLYSAPVTSHIFSQRVNFNFSSRECCIDLGYVPQSVTFVDVPGEESLPQRETIVVFFKYLAPDKPHKVYLPAGHSRIIKRIYKNLKTDRIFSRKKTVHINENTFFQYRITSKWTCSWIGIFNYGKDFPDVFKSLVKEILSKKIETIHIDLPLNNPLTPKYYKVLEDAGFFFIGIIPNFLRSADAVRFQYLVSRKIDFSRINVYSKFAKELLEYIKVRYLASQRSA